MDFKDAAITMEFKMHSFYSSMASKVQSQRARDLLRFLAGEELEHSRFIDRLTSVKTDTEMLNHAFSEAGDIMGYLVDDLLARTKLSHTFEDETAILKLALQSEEEARIFYSKLHDLVQDLRLKAQVRILMDYEDDHMKKLGVVLNVLMKERGGKAPE